jgi:hypothetical protein
MRAVVVTIAAVLASSGAANPLYLSDIGYIDNSGAAPTCYLPHLQQPNSSSREMPIGPEAGTAVGAQWGDIVWANPRDPDTGAGYYDALIDSLDVAGRAVTVSIVDKVFDQARGIWLDSNPVSGGVVIFSGIALNWVTDGKTVNLRIRDNLAVLEAPIQQSFYTGAGGAQGTTDIANQPIPKTRGIVSNITPILINPTLNVYQCSDAAISALTVYEGGIAGFSLTSDFATYSLLAAATLTAGQYATCLAGGYFRLGTVPVYDITCDLLGSFPSGATKNKIVDITLAILEEDCGIASAAINVSNFTTLQSDFGNTFGGIFTGSDNATPIDLLSELVGALNCSIGTDLNGVIDIFQLVDPTGSGTVANFTTAHILDGAQSVDLPDSVIVPNWRRTLSCNPNDTVQSGNSLKATVTQSRRLFLGKAYSRVVWASGTVHARYPTALDAPIIVSRLSDASVAQTFVNAMGALWGDQRYLYDLPFPRDVLLPSTGPVVELGDVVGITFPLGKLAAGVSCQVVGMALDMQAGTVTLRVFL